MARQLVLGGIGGGRSADGHGHGGGRWFGRVRARGSKRARFAHCCGGLWDKGLLRGRVGDGREPHRSAGQSDDVVLVVVVTVMVYGASLVGWR